MNNKGTSTKDGFCSRSGFVLTFAVELLGLDVWHDCQEGWLDLGPSIQGVKFQYQLYPGYAYDIDALVWPHTVKIWCGSESGWVRTFQYLDRRWFTFSIRHAFPVRVTELRDHQIVVTPTFGLGALGNTARGDKNEEVFLPPLEFGQKRYFGHVWPFIESEETRFLKFVREYIWSLVAQYIPASLLEEPFDIPQVVSDVRHQDAIIDHIQNIIVNTGLPEEGDSRSLSEDLVPERRRSSKLKDEKEKQKRRDEKFELKLSGDAVLAGVGRISAFNSIGRRPEGVGEIVVLLSSINLPAHDDMPILFVNIGTLFDVPLAEMRKLRISTLYTRWTLKDEVHDSEHKDLTNRKIAGLASGSINFDDHHAIPIPSNLVTESTSVFLEDPYRIELRGTRYPASDAMKPKFFGYDMHDRELSTSVPKSFMNTKEELDFLIATTKIDGRQLARGINTFIRGEYSLYPITVSVVQVDREKICTNDINAVRAPVLPKIVVPAHLIIQTHMSLEVSIGVVGCKPHRLRSCFSRIHMLINNIDDAMAIVTKITQINEETSTARCDELLTGFAIDTGTTCLFYVEGPRDGNILKIWEMTEDFYPRVKPLYNSSARYFSRIYKELIEISIPFVVLKLHVNIGVLLALPSIYVRPTLPLPARSALLKINRIMAGKLIFTPPRCLMPTTDELKSLRLEMCTPPRPPLLKKRNSLIKPDLIEKVHRPSFMRINWEKN